MDFSSIPTFRPRPPRADENADPGNQRSHRTAHSDPENTRCPHFAGFVSISMAGDSSLGLHPFVTNLFPHFEDVTLGGGSFDVRKVKASSFPTGLGTDILKNREFVVVKHPRATDASGDWRYHTDYFADIATELQILRHGPLKSHENIIDLLAVMYHDTGTDETRSAPRIVPALVLEYAEYGNLKAFQKAGNGASISDRAKIALDAAKGLKALHDVGIIHGDMKPSNLLVCKHPARDFIVKLADFGFSLSVEDGKFVGYSQMFCPPESYDGQLDRTHLPQVDIYSFGLTLLTIIESGKAFYDDIPAEGAEENVMRMKKKNLMSNLMPLRILRGFKGSGLPINILCKIFHYCLRASPSERFRDMDRVIALLDAFDRVAVPFSSNAQAALDVAAIAEASSILTQASTTVRNDPSSQAGALEQQFSQFLKLIQLILTSLGPLIGAGLTTMPTTTSAPLREMTGQLVQTFLQFDQTLTNKRQDGLGELFHNMRSEKTVQDLFEVFGQRQDAETGQPVQSSMGKIISFLVDLIGLLPEPCDAIAMPDQPKQTASEEAAKSHADATVNNKNILRLKRHLNLIPNLDVSFGAFQKLLPLVQYNVNESLEMIVKEHTDPQVKAAAAYNLAISYMSCENHFDQPRDFDKRLQITQKFLFLAAELGNASAKIATFKMFRRPESVGERPLQEVWASCVKIVAEARSLEALDMLRKISPETADRVKKAIKSKCFEDVCTDLASRNTTSPSDSREASLEPNIQLLFWAIIEDQPEVVDQCVRASPEILSQRAGLSGDTPLTLACQLARVRTAEILIGANADVNQADNRRVTPLHWLFSFQGNDCHRIATLLSQKGAKPDALGPQLETMGAGLQVATEDLIPSTPLHWAVASMNVFAVEALVNIGANPVHAVAVGIGKPNHLRPLDVACRMCYSPTVAALLQVPAAREALVTTRAMINGQRLTTRPMFQCLTGYGRWARLKTLGLNFEEEVRKTIGLCVANGAPTDAVLEVDADNKMSAIFAIAFHQCPSEIMRAGLANGFAAQIDGCRNKDGKGDNALFMAINHRNRDMAQALLDAGASTTILDLESASLMERAAKESDDIFFVRALLGAGRGATVGTWADDSGVGPFETAVYSGNLKVARYLYDRGADRDRVKDDHRTALGSMIHFHTRNAVKRVQFLLSLPDRKGGSDGFIAVHDPRLKLSALHLALMKSVEPNSSESMQSDVTEVMIATLLEKYDAKKHLESKVGPGGMTPLILAVHVGHHGAARRLLEKGADACNVDEQGHAALDLAKRRYFFPETSMAIANLGTAKISEVQRLLKIVNENTVELVGLLVSYGATGQVGEFPSWYKGEEELQTAEHLRARFQATQDDVEDRHLVAEMANANMEDID